jgi:quercetin dioxygenase-like cupin family protein
MKKSSLQQLPTTAVSHNPAIRKKVMLQKGDVPQLTNFSQAHFPPGELAAAHAHPDMYEVFFVEAGQGEMWVNGEAHALTPGVCITIEPGETHEVQNTGDTTLVLTYFGIVSP